MKTMLVNGSPKAEHGNTQVFIDQFQLGAQQNGEVRYVAREGAEELANAISTADTVLIFMPMYVHAMPGQVMALLEHMKPAREGQSIGFVVQYGFVEGNQAKHLQNVLEAMAKRLGYFYLGTVVKGGAAGVSMMPESMNQKLFANLRQLGDYFQQYHGFDPQLQAKLAEPYSMPKRQLWMMNVLNAIGIGNLFWNRWLKSNNAYENRLDQPFG